MNYEEEIRDKDGKENGYRERECRTHKSVFCIKTISMLKTSKPI